VHEASLMKNLLAIVERAARDEGGGSVRVVHLRIGEMAGVSPDALQFAFDVMSKGTTAEGGVLEIGRVPLSVRCKGCGATVEPKDFVFVCPVCGSAEIEILTGREMEVDYIVTGEDGTNDCSSKTRER
jgi:hydrogenase nickel incorporation protein HypA/HybF